MSLKDECEFSWFNSGKGGQGQNKRPANLRLRHVGTNVTVTVRGRKRSHNQKKALKLLAEKLDSIRSEATASVKKAARDEKIKPVAAIRTYNFQRGTVKDHRTGKVASLKDVLEKGDIDLLR